MIRPQTAAPPRYSRPSTGPRSIQGAQVIRLKNANCTVTTHIQRTDLKYVHPSAMSCHTVRRTTGFRAGTRSRRSAMALTA
jgi:hypothetical protein